MISHERTRGGEWKIYRFTLLVLVAMGFIGLLVVEKSMAQQSGGSSITILPGEGLRAGPFRIHPLLRVSETYTDNVFRTKSNRQSDFVHSVSPSLQVQLPFAGLHQAVIDYQATQSISQRFSSNNVPPRHSLNGQVLLNFPGGLNLKLLGGYTKGFIARGSAVDVQASEPTRWNTKTFVGEAATFGSQLGVRLQVQATALNFENNNQAPIRDRFSGSGDFSVFGKIAPKTSALLNVGVTRQLYDQNTQLDSANFRVSSGLRWSATGKTTGEIQVGYEVLNFDHAPVTQPAGSPLSPGGTKTQNLRISGNVNWKATERSTIQFRPFRTIQQSGVFNTSTFTKTGFSLSAGYAIGTRTTINSNFQYSNDDFANDSGNQTSESRIDNRLGGSLGISYNPVRWLGITGQYQYQQRLSTIDSFEFYANTLMVSINGVF